MACARDILRGQKSLCPLKMAHKVIVPQKKIMSLGFLNSGTLIVIVYIYTVQLAFTHHACWLAH
jgi:hypothetical protein